MPFGLINALATCQMLINDTLREHLDRIVIAYLDDILVYTEGDLVQHIYNIQQVLDKLLKKNLRAVLEKCEFYKKEIDFLRFIVGVNSIRMDLAKVKDVLK